jgi:cystathionine beta-synthase
VVVIFHDHGTRYIGKMFNPAWMRMMGYETLEGSTARDLVRNKRVAGLVSLEVDATVDQAILCMGENDFSQIPILQNGRVVGSVSESRVYAEVIKDPAIRKEPVKTIMQRPFRFVDIETPVSLLAPMITPEHPAVLVRDFSADKTYILTGHDILKAL